MTEIDTNIMAIDLGPEDAEAPAIPAGEIETLTPADAVRAVDRAEAAVAVANRAIEDARKQKKRAKAVALAVLEKFELDSAKTTIDSGDRVLFYTERFRTFNIVDEPRFDAWEAEQDENYYEERRTLRGDLFLEECHRRENDGEPLPPGVVKYEELRLKRKADPKRRS